MIDELLGHTPLQRRAAQATLALVCLCLGVLLVTQFRTQGKLAKTTVGASSSDQAAMISSLYEGNLLLRREVAELERKLDEQERSLSQSSLDSAVKELNDLRILNGSSEVSGPGIEVLITREVKAQDLLDLVNELRNAGAEALALNGIRLVARSAISVDGGRNYVNDLAIEAPYTLVAIGHSDTLERALLRKGGLVSYLESTYPAATILVSKRAGLVLPKFKGSYGLRAAKPTK